jgi:DNA-binding NtrC family response regulator
VVYGIVIQHEGWITLRSEIDKGTTFEIFIPTVSQKPEDHTIEALSLDSLQGEGKRILVVEDAEGVREFAAMALRENGYRVYTAANVSEAIRTFDSEDGLFDLVITDVVLPDQSGLDLIQHLHKNNPEIEVLLSSGYTDQKSQWPLIRENEYRFLQKPYALSELLKMVKQTFE